jgi:hypothetical protein
MVTVEETYLMLVDGQVVSVDVGPMLRRHRAAHIEARAGAIDQAADLLMDQALDVAETWDAAEAQDMSADAIDSAGVTGWFAYRRVGADTPTATALRVHNNAQPMAARRTGGPSPAGKGAAGVVCPGCGKPLEDASRNVHEGCPEDRRLWVSVRPPQWLPAA